MVALGSEPIRWLRPLSWVYGLGVRARNMSFELGLRHVRRLPVPVVSVGNLSVGGTGKTPLVVWLIERYRQAGLRVGVLARGYARESGQALNDEGRLLQSRFPDLAQEQDADRYAAGLRLVEREEVDLLLLDDGFQHRRLHRDIDVCLIDAKHPEGGGLLPAGWLREPPSALRRADVFVVTGAQAVDGSTLERTVEWLRSRHPERPCLACSSQPRDLLRLPTGEVVPVADVAGRRVHLVAAIARPERFRATCVGLGADVATTTFLRDHAQISRQTFDRLASVAARDDAWLVLTEKDEARLAFRKGEGPPRFVLRIDLAFDGAQDVSTFLPPGLGGA